MQGTRINRNLLKLVYRFEESDIESYRLYIISRAHFSFRSGIFSLDELCTILHTRYGYKSLHKKPGNKRSAFKKKYRERFTQSFLFREAVDGRFILNSERKLLNRFKGTTKSSWYELPDQEVLQSKRLFKDFCIGVLLAGNKFRANSNISGYCNCTKRRVQLATARNHKKQTFTKQFNYINDFSASYKEVQRKRAELLNIHGITSPLPVKYKNEWVLRLNAPNSYQSQVMCGVKGFATHPTRPGIRKKEECWFKPIRQKNAQLKLFKDNYKKWMFNESVYSINTYVQDNSQLLNT